MKGLTTVILLLEVLAMLSSSYSSSSVTTNCSQSGVETTCTVLMVEEVPGDVLVFNTTMYLTCGVCLVSSQGLLYNNHFKEDTNKRIFTKGHLDRESLVIRSTAPQPVIISLTILDLTSNHRVHLDIHIVDLDDNIPQFKSGGSNLPDIVTKNIPEGTSVGSPIFTLEAVDYDEGINGTSLYILDQSDPPYFALQVTNTSGRASIADIYNIKPLDREMNESFTLTITALEGTANPRNDTLTLKIIVEDVNDHPPVFDTTYYNIPLPQWTLVGQEIVELSATDNDIGPNADIEYSIKDVCIEFNPPDGDCIAVVKSGWPFSIEPQTGILRLAHFVTCMVAEYRVTVNAANPNTPHGGLATAIVWIETVPRPQINPAVTTPVSFLSQTSKLMNESTALRPSTSSAFFTTKTSPESNSRDSHTSVHVQTFTTPPFVGVKYCDTRLLDYCLTAGAGVVVLLFVSMFLNVVLITVIVTSRSRKSVALKHAEKTKSDKQNRALPPPPPLSPSMTPATYTSLDKNRLSTNTLEYDAMHYGHVEFMNTIYESLGDQSLTETEV